jgi:hypothetical protein
MNEGGGKAGIKVSFSWSSEISGTDNLPKEIVFPPKAMPIIEAFADKLETYTALDVEVRGKIIRLQRSEEDSKGQIVIKGLVKDLEEKELLKLNYQKKNTPLQPRHIMKKK